MKLLLDQNISFRVVAKIKEVFPSSQSVKNLNLWDRNDFEIWMFALENDYCIVTFDEDLYNFNSVFEKCPKIIWFRTGNISNQQVADALINNKDIILAFLSGDIDLKNNCLEINQATDL